MTYASSYVCCAEYSWRKGTSNLLHSDACSGVVFVISAIRKLVSPPLHRTDELDNNQICIVFIAPHLFEHCLNHTCEDL